MHKTSGPFGKQTVNLQNIKLNYHTRSPNCGQKKNTNQLRPMRQKECDWVRHRLSLLIWLDVRSNYFRTCCHQTVLKEFNHGHGSHGRIDMLITAIYSVTCSCQIVKLSPTQPNEPLWIISFCPFIRLAESNSPIESWRGATTRWVLSIHINICKSWSWRRLQLNVR